MLLHTLVLLIGCTRNDAITVLGPVDDPALPEAVAFVGDSRLTFVGAADPLTEPARGTVLRIVPDLDVDGAFSVDGDGDEIVVHGGGVLGEQMGLSAALEAFGYRFLHPYDTFIPERLEAPESLALEAEPEIDRRGLQLHTLHPIEGLEALWVPSNDHLTEAKRIIDWEAKNGGNHLQWPGLDNIQTSEPDRSAWEAHSVAIADYAHKRGLTVGIGVQLFGSSNLQEAFDLLDTVGSPAAQEAAIDERLAMIGGVPWDQIVLSFGEFFGEEPESFLASTNLAYDRMQAVWPGVEVSAVIHVGDSPDQRVDYNGESLQYYFLVKYANPAIVPQVHTVMFYDLFEPTNGAYLHENFDEHKAFLLDRLNTDKPVGYFPESAYWVAFDNSVPQFYPLYVQSRWTDLDGIRAASAAKPLEDHTLFSSGWEWGFWLNDRATLRLNYKLRPWQDEVADAYAPLEGGPETAQAVIALTELQNASLIHKNLARWLSGRDVAIDFGDTIGVVSQPDRPMIKEIAAMGPTERAEVEAAMVDLDEYRVAVDAILADLPSNNDRWVAEVRDGLEIDSERAQFVASNTRAVLASAAGEDPAAHIASASAALDAAKVIVARRRAGFHDPNGERWVTPQFDNPTTYDFGYLTRGDELCYWVREQVESTNAITGSETQVPGCLF